MYDPSNPYPASIQGTSWAGQPPQSMNPFAMAGTSMIQDYAIMKQRQELEQYQQLIQSPAQMSPRMQSRIAYEPQFNFGMVGGQSQMYEQMQRNSLIGGTSMALTGATAAMTWPIFGIGSRIATPLLTRMAPSFMGGSLGGVAGTIAGGALGMAMTAPFYALANRGIDRARFASDIEGDIADYSSRWTSGVGFGRSATRSLSMDMMREMNQPGQFFRAEDQLKIHKMGLAGGLIKGRDTTEYKKSFDELKKNAQDVIKMLNTTIEGGMSVMKEMYGAGITSTSAVRQQVMNARGIGQVSGIGTQNALALGAAGAMAARGTGWSPVSMSNAYQSNAATIANMALNSTNVNNAVIGMGGIAQAAAAMANIQSNVFRSGMGIQSMAAIMDPRTRGVDAAAFERLASGKMGVFELTSRAGAYGSDPARRVLYEKNAMQNFNKMSEEQKAHYYRGIYKAYASTRGGESEAAAWEFAGQFTRSFDERVMFSEMVGSPVNFAPQRSAAAMQRYQMGMSNVMAYTPIMGRIRSVGNAFTSGVNKMADNLYGAASSVVDAGASIYNSAISTIFGSRGAGLIDRYRAPSAETVSQRLYGYNRVSEAELSALRSFGGTNPSSTLIDEATNSKYRNALNNIRSGLAGASAEMRQQFYDVFAGGTSSGANLQDNLWMSGNFGLNKQTMAMLKDENVRRSMLSTLNREQEGRNSAIRNAQINREAWGSAERNNYYVMAGSVQNMVSRGVGAEEAINRAIGSRSGMADVKTLLQNSFGVSSIANVSDVGARISAEERAASIKAMRGSYSRFVPGKSFALTADIFAAGTSDDVVSNALRRWNKASNNTARMGLLGEFRESGIIGNVGFDVFNNFATSRSTRDALNKVDRGDAAEAYSKIRTNVKYGLGGDNAPEGVIAAVMNLVSKPGASKTEKDQWMKQAQTSDVLRGYKTIDQIVNFAIGAGAGSSAALEMDKIKSDAINKLDADIKSISRGEGQGKGVDKDKRDELIKQKLIELNQLKNEGQSTAQTVSTQSQQTAAPNILNYWNCQWMVR